MTQSVPPYCHVCTLMSPHFCGLHNLSRGYYTHLTSKQDCGELYAAQQQGFQLQAHLLMCYFVETIIEKLLTSNVDLNRLQNPENN